MGCHTLARPWWIERHKQTVAALAPGSTLSTLEMSALGQEAAIDYRARAVQRAAGLRTSPRRLQQQRVGEIGWMQFGLLTVWRGAGDQVPA